MSFKDPMGDRMKGAYEAPFRHTLPSRSFVLIRLDGRAFHTFTKGLEKPYDLKLINDLGTAALALAQEASNCVFAHAHSDEMSFLLSDWDKNSLEKQPWFGNNQSKLESISSSIVTGTFAKLRPKEERLATFDSRAFAITLPHEVHNYFVWRQFDCKRNAVQAIAQKLFTHSQLQGKNIEEMKKMMAEKGHPIEQYPAIFKLGQMIHKNSEGEWICEAATDFSITGEPKPLADFLTNV